MIKIGITGGIGSGKSTVSELFSICRIPVYIADIESKKLVNSSPIIKKKLIQNFGSTIYDNDKINKQLLASYIFSDKQKLELVNSIIHPEVERNYREWLIINNKKQIVANESAILFESGFQKLVDKTITVYTPLEMRIERTMKRDGITREKVLERIANQMPDEQKVKLSDFTIVNDGTKSLIEQFFSVLEIIKKETYDR